MNTTKNSHRIVGLMTGVASLAFMAATGAYAQTATPSTTPAPAPAKPASAVSVSEVVVTGSRVIKNGNNSPTPLTVVQTEQLLATTPSDIPQALDKLPLFQGSQRATQSGDASSNIASDVLSLRNFGAQRTLTLIDGIRAAPSNANGTVDADTLPDMLVSRVDVVTGGASAVYGSDAVTGVVNFVLDHKFEGLKFDANTGVSNYGDAASFKTGIAGGHSFLGGRLHVEGSYEHYHIDPVSNTARPDGPGVYVLTGSGTAADPFAVTTNTRRADSTFGGLVDSCTNKCSGLGEQFVADGVLGPYYAGTKSGTANQNASGDGAYSQYSTALVEQRQDHFFGRADYDLTDNVQVYLQGSYAEAAALGWHFPAKLTPGSTQASTFFANNPFLPAATQAALGNNGHSNSTNTFNVGQYFSNLGPSSYTGAQDLNLTYNAIAGATGTFADKYHWDAYYSYDKNVLIEDSLNNSNYQNQFAALDAVVGPTGQIECYAATQAATAARYAKCVPLNPFGPTNLTEQQLKWFTSTTQFQMTNTMSDTGASVSGAPVSDWAGPITLALSGEMRWNTYQVASNATPSANVNCTGLRICNSSLPLFAQPVLGSVYASDNVWEIALEGEIPLAKDLPLIKNLTANVAGRYTDYSTSGVAETWKIGLDYQVTDEFRLRATTSVDIRAPTLNDLYQPTQLAVTGFVDLHTSTSNTTFNTTEGNPNLVPEVARTWTGGAVYRPHFLPGFSTSVDWYQIRINNAIGTVAASNNTVQVLCENSGGSSPYCALFKRPYPFSDHSSDNFPTQVYTEALNVAFQEISGVDLELDYGFSLARFIKQMDGRFTLRMMGNYQPENESEAFPGAPITFTAAPKVQITSTLGYSQGPWSWNILNRYLSSWSQVTSAGQVWVDPIVPSYMTFDVEAERKFAVPGGAMTGYVSIQNLFNAIPPLVPGSGAVGLTYPVAPGYDIMGRYFTVGIKAKF